jgi:hypothetical protein
MKQTRKGRAVPLLVLLSLALVVLTGCSGDDTQGENSSQATSRLILQLTPADPAGSNPRHSASLLQPQQVEMDRVQIIVSGSDIDTIEINCTLPEPLSDEPCSVMGETDETVTVEVTLDVPRGNQRQITVTLFEAGTPVLQGDVVTVDLTEAEQRIDIVLRPIGSEETTTVVGNVTDLSGNGVAGASLTTNGGLTGVTEVDGSFAIPNVPTNLGNIAVGAAFTIEDGTLTGSSPSVPPVPGGDTDVGTIVILLLQQDEEAVVLRSDAFQIPAGIDTLRFNFNFLSNEFPNFVGGRFNDTSFALVRADSDTVETRVLANVNTATFDNLRDAESGLSPAGFNGQTGFLTATFDVSSLAGDDVSVVLEISVRDVGDNVIDSALLLDNIRLVNSDTGNVQSIPNGNFEAGNFNNFTVTFTDVSNTIAPPVAGVITGLGTVDSEGGGLSTTVIGPPQGDFMVFLATGTDALDFIAIPPSVVIMPMLSPPILSSITPNSGPTTGGTLVTLTGTGFQVGASVTIGDTAATNITVVDTTQITAVTPAGVSGTADVVVVNPDSQSASLPGGFTYTVLSDSMVIRNSDP